MTGSLGDAFIKAKTNVDLQRAIDKIPPKKVAVAKKSKIKATEKKMKAASQGFSFVIHEGTARTEYINTLKDWFNFCFVERHNHKTTETQEEDKKYVDFIENTIIEERELEVSNKADVEKQIQSINSVISDITPSSVREARDFSVITRLNQELSKHNMSPIDINFEIDIIVKKIEDLRAKITPLEAQIQKIEEKISIYNEAIGVCEMTKFKLPNEQDLKEFLKTS